MGYRNILQNGKRLIEPDPDVAPGVIRAFELYADGSHSLLDLADMAAELGLVYRQTGNPIRKTTIHKILTNPIYHGIFRWKGKEYPGNHEPLISKELFDQVQEQLQDNCNTKTTKQRRTWAFQGLVTCGKCGCAMIGEMRKGRYIYYHCTGHSGRCDQDWLREEELERLFRDVVAEVRIPEEVLPWIIEAVRSAASDDRQARDNALKTLSERHNRLQARIEAMYEDKLDGRVTPEFFDERSRKYRAEIAEIERKIAKQRDNNIPNIDDGVRILELASRAVELFEQQEMMEKKCLLKTLTSNFFYENGKLIPTYRKPFDLIVLMNQTLKKEKPVSIATYGRSPSWLGNRDSNPDLQIQSLSSCQLDDSPIRESNPFL